MSEEQLTRKERERLRHKQEILDTALRLFSERGFSNVSMQEIADTSEFSVGTLYNFFNSKESLFEELTNSCGDRILRALKTILDEPGTEAERLTNFIRSSSTLLEEHSLFIKLYVSELGTRGVKLSKIREKENIDTIINDGLEQILKDGISKGYFRRVDPAITAKAINSTIETLGFEMASQFDKAVATDMFAKVEQLFVGGLLLPEGK
ncbi:MAG: TetR/AcrR family transcriptional regulator [Sedimentisphaerales bacterium]|nr:TetR/AcrR family transcriptional regulator [Sedimentisphaerales bacterium]